MRNNNEGGIRRRGQDVNVLEEARLAQLDALGYGLSPIVMGNTYDNIIWQLASNETWFPDIIKIPTLQIGGWYDHNIDKI